MLGMGKGGQGRPKTSLSNASRLPQSETLQTPSAMKTQPFSGGYKHVTNLGNDWWRINLHVFVPGLEGRSFTRGNFIGIKFTLNMGLFG